MGFFGKLMKSKNPDSPNYRRAMAERICGQRIKYVTERQDGIETVIGKGGGLNLHGDEFLVYSSADVVFRCKVDDLRVSELLSKDGVVLTGHDLEHGGAERTIIAFYVYYRK